MKPGGDPTPDLVREAARERDVLADPRWEALARGELSPEAGADLRRADAEAYEALRPLDAAAQERMVDRAMDAFDRIPPVAVIQKRWRRATAIALLAAASLALLYLPLSRIPISLMGGRREPLPRYQIVIEGGERDVRSSEPKVWEPPPGPRMLEEPLPGRMELGPLIRLRSPETRLEIRLRPATAYGGKVHWSCSLLQKTEGPMKSRRWFPPGAELPGGTVVISGTREELFSGVPPGHWMILCGVSGSDGGLDQPVWAQVQLGDVQ